MKKIKTVLMSSTLAGCSYAETLKNSPNVKLLAAITCEGKAAGRGRKKRETPVSGHCRSSGVEVLKTDDINSPRTLDKIKALGAESALVVDFGQILSEELLSIFPLGCFNIHYSLLPDLRGAAPVRWALMKGYEKTGVTAIKMNAAIDAGEIIFKKEVKIAPRQDYRVLKDKLTGEGRALAGKLFTYLSEGRELPLKEQDSCAATAAPKIDKKICRINWSLDAEKIVNIIRALAPEPGCWCVFEKKNLRLKILRARPVDSGRFPGRPGQVTEADKKTFSVKAGSGALQVLKVHPSGRRAMKTAAFLAGNPVKAGDVFR